MKSASEPFSPLHRRIAILILASMPTLVSGWITALPLGKTAILLVIIAMYFILGCLLERHLLSLCPGDVELSGAERAFRARQRALVCRPLGGGQSHVQRIPERGGWRSTAAQAGAGVATRPAR